MARGQKAKDGDTNISANGYHYTRRDGKWRLTHHLIAEKQLGRPIDSATETVRFIDNDRSNLDPDNIKVIAKKNRTKAAQIAELRARIEDLQDKLEALELE